MPAAVATDPSPSTIPAVEAPTRPREDAGAPEASHHIGLRQVSGVALLTLVLFSVGIVSLVQHRGSFGGLFGDRAVLALTARDAWTAPALVGPYSRFYWHHPGPAYFYLLGTWRAVFGDSTLAFELGAVAINVGAAFGVLLVAFRRGGAALLAWTTFLFALYLAAIGPVAFDVWNPSVTLLPFALVLLLAWSVACGERWAAPALVAVASFTVQTHVGLAAGVLAACAFAAAVGVVQHRRDRDWRRPLAASAAVLVVCWLPPLVEQVTRSDGNLAQLVRFFAESGSPHDLSEGVARTAAQSTLLVRATFSGAVLRFGTDEGLAFALVVSGAALIGALVLARRARARAPLALLGLVAVQLVVGVCSVTRIVGPVQFYLVQWLSAVGLVFWIAVGHSVLVGIGDCARSLSPRRSVAIAAVVVLAGAVALTSGMGSADAARGANEDLAADHNRQVFGRVPLQELLAATRTDRVTLLALADDSAWEILAADALQLVQHGRAVRIVASPVTRLLFDDALLVHPRSGTTLVFRSRDDRRPRRSDEAVVATQGRWRILLREVT